eukprot:5486724-Pyramimonas_sp.AAC.1
MGEKLAHQRPRLHRARQQHHYFRHHMNTPRSCSRAHAAEDGIILVPKDPTGPLQATNVPFREFVPEDHS